MLLTSTHRYWEAGQIGVMREQFKLHRGGEVSGRMEWKEAPQGITKKRRDPPLDSMGCYRCDWVPYHRFGNEEAGGLVSVVRVRSKSESGRLSIVF